jgi:hypothetical protein
LAVPEGKIVESWNLSRIILKVEIIKHRESSNLSKEIVGPIFQCFVLIFPLWNRGIIVFSHCETNHFIFAYGKFKFFLMVPQGILKNLVRYELSKFSYCRQLRSNLKLADEFRLVCRSLLLGRVKECVRNHHYAHPA